METSYSQRSATTRLTFLDPRVVSGLTLTQYALLLVIVTFLALRLGYEQVAPLDLVSSLLFLVGLGRCAAADFGHRQTVVTVSGAAALGAVGCGVAADWMGGIATALASLTSMVLWLVAIAALLVYASLVCSAGGYAELAGRLRVATGMLVALPLVLLGVVLTDLALLKVVFGIHLLAVMVVVPVCYLIQVSHLQARLAGRA